MEDAQGILFFCRQIMDYAGGVGRIVPTDVKEIADVVLLKRIENFAAVCAVGLIARRSERRGGRRGESLKEIMPEAVEGNEFLFDNPAHAVSGPKKLINMPKP